MKIENRKITFPQSDIKKYKRFLIVGEGQFPMAWDQGSHQLCYCTTSDWQDEHYPVKHYSWEEAQKYIRQTIRNRGRWKMKIGNYKTMPIVI